MKIALETERLLLRPLRSGDEKDMFLWTGDREVSKYVTWNAYSSLKETKDYLEDILDDYDDPKTIRFGIEYKSDHRLIGVIDVVTYLEDVPVIGYCLNRSYWNHGIMTEALKKVADFLFSIGYDTIRVDAVKENIGSNKVIMNCGGVLIDTVNRYLALKKENKTVNCYLIRKENEVENNK